MIRYMVLAGLLLSMISCSSSSTPESAAGEIADSFVSAYYVNANLKGALSFCETLACEKLKREIALRDGQKITAATKVPDITAKQIKVLDEAEGAKRYLYMITVKPSGIDPFKREIYVKVRKDTGAWKVSQFSELKGAPVNESGP